MSKYIIKFKYKFYYISFPQNKYKLQKNMSERHIIGLCISKYKSSKKLIGKGVMMGIIQAIHDNNNLQLLVTNNP